MISRFLAEIFVRIVGPLHSLFMKSLAYGPWGPLHPLIIRIFAGIYGIPVPKDRTFKNLGDFFLRDLPFKDVGSTLASPAESILIDGPTRCGASPLAVKGLCYEWSEFPELDKDFVAKATYWNLYLAPYHYHWVHAPSEGSDLEAIHLTGKKYPVNALGRFLCPQLYLENERMSFRWTHPQLGRVVMMCVGAMGVSSLYSALGAVQTNRWTPLRPHLERLQKLLAFRLGSTVILLVENAPSSVPPQRLLKVGDAL